MSVNKAVAKDPTYEYRLSSRFDVLMWIPWRMAHGVTIRVSAFNSWLTSFRADRQGIASHRYHLEPKHACALPSSLCAAPGYRAPIFSPDLDPAGGNLRTPAGSRFGTSDGRGWELRSDGSDPFGSDADDHGRSQRCRGNAGHAARGLCSPSAPAAAIHRQEFDKK